MKQEVRADLLLGRDTLSPGLVKAGRAAAGAGGNVKDLTDKLRHLSDRTYDARLGLKGDKETGQTLDKLTAQLLRLSQRKVDPEVDLEGYLRTRAQITGIELALDRLNAKRTRLHIAVNKAAGLSLFQPGALGTAVALLPTLIPLTATVAAGAAAIGASFGAAAIGVAGFGLVAKSVLSEAASDSKKLQALQSSQAQQLASLQTRLGEATTKAQRRSLEQQIANLKASQARQTAALTQGWSKGYRDLLTNYQQFQDKWERISKSIAVPTLNVWLPVLTRGLQFLKPLIKPVADAFTLWGISLNTYFKDPAAAKHIKDMAAAFGNFAAQQLFRIGQFIKDIGQGVFNLGKDLASSGANFSSFGVWLSGIGDAFLKWSKSKQARDDVQGFMKFLHDEGPVVKGILRDLGKLLPGIFAGATTVGTLELQALGDFLNLIAGLPKGWQKGLTEAVGALLLLSKLGVVKVGLKLAGWSLAGSAAEGAAGAGGTLAALQRSTGLKWVFRAGVAVAVADIVARITVAAVPKQPSANVPKGPGWAVRLSEMIFGPGIVNVAAWWNTHISQPIKASGKRDLELIKGWWHDIAHWFDVGRHWVATAWDTIWRNTVTRAGRGVSDVISWFKGLPGRAVNALSGLGSLLYAFAHQALVKFGNGAKAVWGSIVKWFRGLPSTILHALGIKSPPDWAISAGRHVMQGILNGLHLGSGGISGFIRGLPGKIGALLTGGSSGATGGDALANQRLARRIFPWGAAQWPAFVNLVMAESGFNRFARNPSSGAYGIPQALPPSKLPFAGQAAGGSHAGPQLSWMFQYIKGRYGTPANAWAHEVSAGWYDKGGWLPPGLTLALNTTGRHEQVISGRSGGAQTVNITVNVPPTVNPRDAGRQVAELILHHTKTGGRLYPAGTRPQ